MHLRTLARAPFVAALLLLVASCGRPAARALRPDEPTYANAVGERCDTGDGNPQPLVVDWRPEHRADLEVAMRHGVAVVAYDCHALRVLPDCTLDGGYGFVGVSVKDQTLHLANADEIKANLPAGVLAASLRAELERGSWLDVELSIVGKQMSTIVDGAVGQLRGRCTGASHFVRAVTTGAFTLDTQARATVDAKAEVAGAEASSNGSADRRTRQADGDRAACQGATADATAPPAGCAAPLRLDLVALSATMPAGALPPAAATVDLPTTRAACPRGLVWGAGGCRQPRPDAAHRCRLDDAADCQRQCTAGDAGSCSDLGFMHMAGRHVALDRRRAADLFERGCAGGDLQGCDNLAAILIHSEPPNPAYIRDAMRLFEKACTGEPSFCNNLGIVYRDGIETAKDPARATELFSRACLAGNATACHHLGIAYKTGSGVPRDVPRGAELADQACRMGDARACAATGIHHLYGEGVAIDEAAAVRFFRYACDHKNQLGCGLLGLMVIDGKGGLARDEAQGRRMMESACESGAEHVCAVLGTMERVRGNEDAARAWFAKACAGGEASSCKS